MKENNYPYRIIYRVDWIDIVSCSEWLPYDDAGDEEPVACVSFGFIAYKDKNKLVISSEYSIKEKSFEIGNKTTIPIDNILSIKKIWEKKNV
jgi:hypothetical protein